jgi:hypothetical protein
MRTVHYSPQALWVSGQIQDPTVITRPLEKHPSTFFQCVDYVRSFLIMLTFPGPLAEIIKSATAVFSRPLSDVTL